MKFKDILLDNKSISYGVVQPGKHTDEGIPLIRVNNIRNGSLILENVLRIDQEIENNYKRTRLTGGELLITLVGTVAECAIAPKSIKDWNVARAIAVIKVNSNLVYAEYLKYWLLVNENKNYLISLATTTVQATLNLKDLKEAELQIPTLDIQKKIISLAASLDDKIELNNRMNKVLEQMAQAIFKQWFIDFEFPNEIGEPYKSSGGEMIESVVGMIPFGWKVSDIESLTELIIDYRGKTPKKLGRNWSETGIIALSAKNIKNEGLVNLDQANRVDEELYNLWMKDELKYGDILLTSEAPLGELYFKANDDKYCLSQRLFAIRADSSAIIPEILYMYLRTSEVMGEIEGRATGTTVTGIRQSELRKVKVINPSSDIQARCQSLLSSVFKKKSVIEKENRKLINVRNTLLPKLMSGEIDVSNVEL
ncbi:restriction endonuclease subunit S [Paenibacillus ihuae]|uniref:restriction endonuclease subunit S n=1 Tax=Paenibacillus ihuae TaxID=1232431 RepID=UPI0006D5AA98|nr:restriction endonuclease subunit S [Paenibacillus ihuae]